MIKLWVFDASPGFAKLMHVFRYRAAWTVLVKQYDGEENTETQTKTTQRHRERKHRDTGKQKQQPHTVDRQRYREHERHRQTQKAADTQTRRCTGRKSNRDNRGITRGTEVQGPAQRDTDRHQQVHTSKGKYTQRSTSEHG